MKIKKLKHLFKNKRFLLFLGVGIVFLIFLIICIKFIMNKPSSEDAKRFKTDFEYYNNKKIYDGKKLSKVKIKAKNKIEYTNLDGALDFLKKGTGIIFFATPDDCKSRTVVETLISVSEYMDVDKVLYLDMRDILDEYEIDDAQVKKLSSASPKYYEMVSILYDYIEDYYLLDSENEIEYSVGTRRLNGPTLVAVDSGKVLDAHTGTVDLKEDQTIYDPLDETQKAELNLIYENIISEVIEN